MIRTYSQLIQLKSFKERFEYLKLNDGHVGEETFRWLRYFNQKFYQSAEWRNLRNHIIARDEGCDLGVKDHEIFRDKIIIHHLNPITIEDIERQSRKLWDPENLITTIHSTHNAIHYGEYEVINNEFSERTPFDTCPWR